MLINAVDKICPLLKFSVSRVALTQLFGAQQSGRRVDGAQERRTVLHLAAQFGRGVRVRKVGFVELELALDD